MDPIPAGRGGHLQPPDGLEPMVDDQQLPGLRVLHQVPPAGHGQDLIGALLEAKLAGWLGDDHPGGAHKWKYPPAPDGLRA